MKNHSKSLLKSIALTVVFTAPPVTASADASQFHIKGTGAVSYVVDGDTLDIRADD
jgi:endonuclease YncB( thermonuclease family)